ncbi:unnamed protein product [Notodromas monacha]|uniref:V-type proton ATPase subunit F n=1 Tax=Notodromas monacha TaxID=399045 RepID=A0A7R9BH08_9CRUS|nr:unnamed protein product [Notodromas monacha]CAG0914610.1 unnamed protein product [Notodromas monacha]
MALAPKGKLIAVIGDEDTCVGFLLGGIGELNRNRQPNFLVVDKKKELCYEIYARRMKRKTLREIWTTGSKLDFVVTSAEMALSSPGPEAHQVEVLT